MESFKIAIHREIKGNPDTGHNKMPCDQSPPGMPLSGVLMGHGAGPSLSWDRQRSEGGGLECVRRLTHFELCVS